ncbi:MAG: CHAP domain-containing protein [Clostridia bacterium]|nr:CHAP domain-containing protein [Clostridia bacterium]
MLLFIFFTAALALSVSLYAFAGADEGSFILKNDAKGFFGAATYENTHKNTGNKAYDIIEVAKTQVGYKESGNNLTKYGEYFDENGCAWCSMFVVWCARQAGISKEEIAFTTWATADDLKIEYRGRDAQRTKEIDYVPLPGDVIVYDFGPATDSYGYCSKEPASEYGDHVGIVEYVKDGYAHTIEGNYSDMVKRRTIRLDDSEIKGYGVPAYNKKHIHYYTDDIVIKQATCAAEGSGKKICFCREEFPYAIKKLSHTPSAAVKENEKKATCAAAGSYDSVVYCSVCKKEISRTAKTTKKLSHTPVQDIEKAATCIHTGLTAGSHCSVCGTVITPQQIIPAAGHKDENGDGVCDVCKTTVCIHEDAPVLSGEKPPSCMQDGYTGDMVCPVCQAVKVQGDVIPADGHSFLTYVYDKNATCTSDGTKTAKCENCGATDTIEVAGTKKQHTYSGWYTVKEATYTANGIQAKSCTACGFTQERATDKKPVTNISKCSFSEIKNVVYTGKAKTPSFTVKNGKTTLKKNVHYSVVYSENIDMGKAKITVSGIEKNGYSGKKVLYFKIIPGKVTSLKASQTTSAVTLKWKEVKGASGYAVYRYYYSQKLYKKLKYVKTCSYTVKGIKPATGCKFYVKAYGGEYGERSDILLTATKPAAPSVTAKRSGSKAVVKWKKVSGATGYEVYFKKSGGSYKKYVDTAKLTLTESGLKKGTAFYFNVRAYKTVNGKKIYSAFSGGRKVKY